MGEPAQLSEQSRREGGPGVGGIHREAPCLPVATTVVAPGTICWSHLTSACLLFGGFGLSGLGQKGFRRGIGSTFVRVKLPSATLSLSSRRLFENILVPCDRLNRNELKLDDNLNKIRIHESALIINRQTDKYINK